MLLYVFIYFSDSKELCSWVETINFVCAAYSAPPLAGAVGSQRKFQRPLLPCTHTKLSMVIIILCTYNVVYNGYFKSLKFSFITMFRLGFIRVNFNKNILVFKVSQEVDQ